MAVGATEASEEGVGSRELGFVAASRDKEATVAGVDVI
jgi:hypothetical protein